MHRTEGENHISNYFTDGPPGTTIEADWLNAIQEEIAFVIENAGLSLLTAYTDTRQQLKTAMDYHYVNRAEPNAPATAASSGYLGQFGFDSDYIYVCVATNTWKRVAISTW